MGKRKHSKSKESDYQSVLRKIRKLETKLRKCRRSSSPVSDSDNSHYVPYYNTQEYEDLSDEQLSDEITDTYEGQPESAEPVAEPSILPEEPVAAPSTSLAAPAPPSPPALLTDNGDDAQKKLLAEDNVPFLDPDLLQLLGEDPTKQKAYGESLHKDIASRWTHILANGLSKDTQLELIKSYLVPENCPTMKAPKLNLEVKAALLEMNVKKDLYSQSKQNQLASSLAAIGRALNWALSTKNIVPPDIIKSLSDAGRLICDNHYKESQSRRYAALSTLDRNIRDTVKNTNIDENLFGSALSDHIKSSKAITRTGSEIKQKAPRPAYRFPAASQTRGALNSRGAPRVASTVEPRSTPAPRRPPRDRRQEASRGRRPTNYARHQTRRR